MEALVGLMLVWRCPYKYFAVAMMPSSLGMLVFRLVT